MPMHLSLMQMITLVASTLGLVSHAAQLTRSLESRSTKGLSLSSFTLLTTTFTLSVLLGIQYKIGPALVLAVLSTALTVGVLALISRWVTAVYLAVVAAVALGVIFGPRAFAEAVMTTKYVEIVAFAWGLSFAVAFVPQVFKARRLRDTHDLSRISLVVSGVSVTLWLTFAVLVKNMSMLFWLSIVLLSLCELIRLKLTEGSRARAAMGQPDPAPAAE